MNISLFATNVLPILTLDAKSVYISIVVDPALVWAAMATWSVPVTDETPAMYEPLILDNDVVKPDITTKSPFPILWLFGGVIRRVSLSTCVITESLYSNVFDVMLEMDTPLIDSTLATSPSPSVPLLSKFNTSPTFWLVPLSTISIEFIDPLCTDSISIFWFFISSASVKKSFPAPSSDTL